MLTTEHRASGLIVARDSMDEASVGAALKRLDGRLVLQKHSRDGVEGGWVYKVVCVVSDNYAPVVFTWQDEHGRPLPLSSGLVDGVQALQIGGRNRPLSEDEHNARKVAERQRDGEAAAEALYEDHRPYVERDRAQVAFTGTGKPRYWRREGVRPSSGAKKRRAD